MQWSIEIDVKKKQPSTKRYTEN